jgi:hypothetical protein
MTNALWREIFAPGAMVRGVKQFERKRITGFSRLKGGTTMEYGTEYTAIQGSQATQLAAELTKRAVDNWHPILMSSAGTQDGVITTVILEKRR